MGCLESRKLEESNMEERKLQKKQQLDDIVSITESNQSEIYNVPRITVDECRESLRNTLKELELVNQQLNDFDSISDHQEQPQILDEQHE